jgi:ankyrin repeat protein
MREFDCPDLFAFIAYWAPDLEVLRALPSLCKTMKDVLNRSSLVPPVARIMADGLGHSDALVKCKDAAVAGEIIKLGKADINAQVGLALRSAARQGRVEKVRALLDAGAKANIGWDGPLVQAAQHGHPEVALLLLRNGANVHHNNDAALHWASARGHIGVVNVLLDHGADVSSRGGAALTWAAKHGHIEVVRALISAGADVSSQNNAALMWAVMFELTDVARVLLRAGASPAEAKASAHGEVGGSLFAEGMAALRITPFAAG